MRRLARWIIPDDPPPEATQLAKDLSLSEPAMSVLWRRGYRDPEAIRQFLAAPLSGLHDPFLLKDMKAAVERILRAISNREKILLYGDYDVDGSTSVVILRKAIELAGGDADFHVPDRFDEGYGMHAEVIEHMANNGVRLVISVDTGIRAGDAVRRANELGVDVIITDHHLPEPSLPPALAVINPNRSDCSYPDKNLCGAGVAFKLAQGLFRRLEWNDSRAERITASFLKITALATVADVVPLQGENRIIVKHGLDGLRSVSNIGLRALLKVAGFRPGERPTAGQVAFRIAPRINAAGRMANAMDVIDLFLTDDPSRARELAGELHALNQDRQQTEAAIVKRVLDVCGHKPVTDEDLVLVFEGENWHRGVVGIVATRLVERFQRPVFVLSIDPEKGLAQGSGRSVPVFHLLEALESMPELFTKFGGHRQAAGLTLPAGQTAEFRRRINEYGRSRLSPDDFRPVREFDARIGIAGVNDKTAADILSLEPFGFGNPAPVLAVEGVEVAGDPVVFKEKHLRVTFRRNGATIRAKAWNFAERLPELKPGARLDAAITFESDDYAAARGYPPWGLVLRDVRASG